MISSLIERLTKKTEIGDIVEALSFEGRDQQRLFDAAKERKPDDIYVRSVIEPSNYCRQNCSYCGMRAGNKLLERFRVAGSELSSLVSGALDTPEVSFIQFSFGEDPRFDFDALASEVNRIYKSGTGKSVTLVLGELNQSIYQKLYDAAEGNDIRYTIKLETTDEDLFSEIKPQNSFEKRFSHLNMVRDIGYQPCSGIIVGLPGQSPEILAKDLLTLNDMPDLANVSASNFVPSPGSPYANKEPGSIQQTLNFMALLRLTHSNPDVTIPAGGSLGKEGQKTALKHFANQLSIHMTPEEMKERYLIYNGGKRIFGQKEKVLNLIEETGGNLTIPKAAHVNDRHTEEENENTCSPL